MPRAIRREPGAVPRHATGPWARGPAPLVPLVIPLVTPRASKGWATAHTTEASCSMVHEHTAELLERTAAEGFGHHISHVVRSGHELRLDQHLLKHFPRARDAGYSAVRIKAGGQVSYHRIFADPLTRAYLSTEPNEYAWCEQRIQSGVPLKTAIAQTAAHFYGEELAAFNQATMASSPAAGGHS